MKVIDEADRKSNFYGWFANSKRLLGPYRVVFSLLTAFGVSFLLYGLYTALVLSLILLFAVVAAGSYGTRVIGGGMGDFLGATICLTELAVYLALQIKWEGLEERLTAGGLGWAATAAIALAPVLYERQMDVVKAASKC